MKPNSLDAPLPVRGVHIDCRAQMLRPERIAAIFADVARWGFNTVLLEYEDRFPYSGRLKSVAAADALTRRQVRELNATARALGLRIVPLVHCLGHLEYVLRLPPFRAYADFHSERRYSSTVCPSHPAAFGLFQEMVSQVLEMHPDCRYFHMGGDEAEMNPACPRCGPRLAQDGLPKLLADHYVRAADWVRRQGPDPILWCDMPLSHPEALAWLRGHVTVMDWDYWSLTKPVRNGGNVWGLPPIADRHDPRTWPPAHRTLFADYVLTEDRRFRPFPYAPFLRDQGFPAIVAAAVRSSGDNFCVPSPLHVENVIGACRTARANHLLGALITSWALRRAPWPLTEYGLIAGAMTMRDPATPREEVDAAFADEHFGVGDPALARIPLLLGAPVRGYLDSRPAFDGATGGWPGEDYDRRRQYLRQNPAYAANARAQLDDLTRNLRTASALLERVRPRTRRQRERVALWNWARETLAHFASFGPHLLAADRPADAAECRAFRAQAVRLAARTRGILRPWYTERTLAEEHQTRFGVHVDYLRR